MDQLIELKGLGPKRLAALNAAGVFTVSDLLMLIPSSWRDTSAITPLSRVSEGLFCVIKGSLSRPPSVSFYRGLSRVTCTLTDGEGSLQLVWYNQAWVKDHLNTEQTYTFSGKISRNKQGRLMMNSPRKETESALIAEYHSVRGLPDKTIKALIKQAMDALDACCPETLPPDFRRQYGLCERNFALRQLHFPSDAYALKTAQRRVSFEKLLLYQTALSLLRGKPGTAHAFSNDEKMLSRFWSQQPFSPTQAQDRVLRQVAADMARSTPMHRMVQGDVGSGKTAVAFGAMCLCCLQGKQAVFMAPTEVLARQHYLNAQRMLEPLGICCGLLTGGMRAKERRDALSHIRSGEWQAIMGTHALLSKDVVYRDLALTITDEQHRFGVKQRNILSRKSGSDLEPHVLVMSATPIPRSLALVLYGDLDLSVLDEMPPGRVPVKTSIVPEEKRQHMYQYVIAQAQAGKQTYIVCPLAESSEESEAASAEEMYTRLRNGPLQSLRLGLTWGSQKTADKDAVLAAFSAGDLDVLVSTTVIEVGVDVPNATTMIIENADRFGLSTLHQLRGRVGRGKDASWCFLMAAPNERLQTLCQTNNGFRIAEKDLQLRGPGEFLGTQQHGRHFLADLSFDIPLLQETQQAVRALEASQDQADLLLSLRERAENMFSAQLKQAVLN